MHADAGFTGSELGQKLTERTLTCLRTRLASAAIASTPSSGLRKLAQLDWSSALDDLKVPPGNSLEALKDDRKGQHSIRINAQWRLCFIWTNDGATEVEIVDYH